MTSTTPKTSRSGGPGHIATVYVPAALLIFGTALIDFRFVPVAILVAGALGVWTIKSSGESFSQFTRSCKVV